MQQKWGKIAEKVAADMYKATLLTSFCKKSAKTEDLTGAYPSTSTTTAPMDLTLEAKGNIQHLFVES